jgi:TPR repeat protein
MLSQSEGILMNKSLAVDYYKLSVDLGNATTRSCYGFLLDNDEGISMNKSILYIVENMVSFQRLLQLHLLALFSHKYRKNVQQFY